ncbi:MAG: hypothetical protein GQ477_04520 [Nanohaloarchaea archaeon]|nr:hypothetical protein [Candidatus Nanohaloarchaea archaeon]
MFVRTIELMAEGEKEDMMKKLDSSEMIGDYDLDTADIKKDKKNIILSFRNPVDIKYVAPAVNSILN